MKEINIIENVIKQMQRDVKLREMHLRKQKKEIRMLLKLIKQMKEEYE
jgi:hypothetical protein